MNINNLKRIPSTGKIDNQFVGIRIFENEIEFHYPETYKLSSNDDDLRRDILSILRTISLARTKTNDLSTYYSSHYKNNVFPLRAYLWIINDYLTYGRYENKEKTFNRGTAGKINWKKTMKNIPLITGRNIVYSNIISEKKIQHDNLITQIYYFCVKQAIDSIGWLYGLSFDENGIEYNKLFNEKVFINAVNTEISQTFDDGKKIRLANMRDILIGLDEDMISSREIIYGVDSYEYVYERMIDEMFSNVENIKDFYPTAEWKLVLEKIPKNSSNLRPDTVLIRDNKVYILDAKYYRYGTTFNSADMPETSSIQKQITYGEYVKKVKAGIYNDVYSAFILPYSKYDNANNEIFNNNMEFVGVAKAAWIDKDTYSNRVISAILVDTTFLVNNWLKRKDIYTQQIVELIEETVGELS